MTIQEYAPTAIDDARPVQPNDFKSFVGSFPTGVTVVTWADRGMGAGGMTVNAFASISMTPPLVMVSLAEGSRALDPVHAAGVFGVNILGGQGEQAAAAFARRATARLEDFQWGAGVLGSPLLVADAEAMADCSVEETFVVGDHTIVIGRVHQAEHRGEAPLGYLRRNFASWG